jgi:hypothetical protein
MFYVSVKINLIKISKLSAPTVHFFSLQAGSLHLTVLPQRTGSIAGERRRCTFCHTHLLHFCMSLKSAFLSGAGLKAGTPLVACQRTFWQQEAHPFCGSSENLPGGLEDCVQCRRQRGGPPQNGATFLWLWLATPALWQSGECRHLPVSASGKRWVWNRWCVPVSGASCGSHQTSPLSREVYDLWT